MNAQIVMRVEMYMLSPLIGMPSSELECSVYIVPRQQQCAASTHVANHIKSQAVVGHVRVHAMLSRLIQILNRPSDTRKRGGKYMGHAHAA